MARDTRKRHTHWPMVALSFSLSCADATATETGSTGEPSRLEESRTVLDVQMDWPKLDILVVVDNSHSMAPYQARLAKTLAKFTEIVARGLHAYDLRLAFADTDAGHPACDGDPGAAGTLQLRSCLDHPEEFTTTGGSTSRFNTACAAHCPYTDAQLQVVPTTTDLDPIPRPRPWIELRRDGRNLPEGISTSDALACVVPLGVSGCDYESQLESSYQALRGSENASASSHGFVRDDASLVVVILSDEADCSYNLHAPGAAGIFAPDNSTFWPPDARAPGSGICWKAGVHCTEGSARECSAANFDAEGQLLGDHSEHAVLWPLSRYTDFFDALAERKRAAGQKFQIAFIGGVGENGQIRYPPGQGEHGAQFGVGPGCEAPVDILEELDPRTGASVPGSSKVATAVPPVRLRDVVSRYADPRLLGFALPSICDPSYLLALRPWLPPRGGHSYPPNCYEGCVADLDPEAPGVQPNCTVTRRFGYETNEVFECHFEWRDIDGHTMKIYEWSEESGYRFPDESSEACFALRGVPETIDDVSIADNIDPACADEGKNLEIYVKRRAGVYVPTGEILEARCQIADTPETCE